MVQKCPSLGGESITDGTVMEWKKKVGDLVRANETICVIETDKVTVDVKADTDGALQEIFVKEEETIEIGKPLGTINTDGTASATAAAPSTPAAPVQTPAASVPKPTKDSATVKRVIEQKCGDFGAESIVEGTIMEWKKSVGDFVEQGELITIIETDKVSVDVKAEERGTITEILFKADESVKVGEVLLKIETGGGPAPSDSAGAAAATPAPPSPAASAPAPAEPAAGSAVPLTGLRATFARLAAQRLGLPDPTVAALATPTSAPPSVAPATATAAVPSPVDEEVSGERRVPLSRVRQRVMHRMKETQSRAALLTTFQEADMSAAIELRTKYKDAFLKKTGVRFGLLSMFAKASALALLEEPGVNGLIDDATSEIVYRDYVDIAVPIPSPRGTISCVLRGVESMSVVEIERSIAALTERARLDALDPQDVGPSSFGITDSGVAGGMLGTGIINPPQSAVLGTNAVTKRAVAVGGRVEARPVMYMALTYDHRLIDGREAVTFLCSVRDKLEDPSRMLIGM